MREPLETPGGSRTFPPKSNNVFWGESQGEPGEEGSREERVCVL